MGKMRAHIQNKGWVSMSLLTCRSRHCGHCRDCHTSPLPAVNARMKAPPELPTSVRARARVCVRVPYSFNHITRWMPLTLRWPRRSASSSSPVNIAA